MGRTVTVALRATNTQYDAAMTASAGKTKALGDEVAKASSTSQRELGALSRASVATREEHTRLASSAERSGGRVRSALGSVGLSAGQMKLGVAAAAAGAGAAIAAFAEQAVDAASALNEQISATKTIFGDAADEMIKFGQSADAIGLSERAALQAGNAFGDLFTKIGYTHGASATLSEDLVRMSADFASFKDLDPDDVLGKLKSGLSGESEPLRALGVFLTEAGVKAEGMRLGLADAHGELTEGEKITARYSLIVKQMGDAYGDVSRTADSYANQQRRAAAETENFKASAGRTLLPFYTDLVYLGGSAASAVGDLSDKLGKHGQSALNAISPIGLLADGVRKLRGDSTDTAGSVNYLTDSEEILANSQKYTKDQVEQATQSLKDQQAALDRLTQATIAQFDSELRYQQSLLAISGDLDDYNQALKKNRDRKKDNDVSTSDMRKMQLGLKQDLLAAGEAAVKAADDHAAAAGRTLTETDKWLVFRDALVKLKKQFPELRGEIDTYIARLGKVPPSVKTTITVDGKDQAVAALRQVYAQGLKTASPVRLSVTISGAAAVDRILTDLAGKTRSIGATIQGNGTNLLLGVTQGASPRTTAPAPHRSGYAAGGLLTGPGNGTSDSMLIRASTGEFVVKASAAKKHLSLLQAINDAPGYASGGMVIPRASRYNAATPLSSQALSLARAGGSVEDVRALTAAYDDYLHKVEQAAAREKLLDDIRTASAERGKTNYYALAAAQRQVAAAEDAVARARRSKSPADDAAATRRLAAAHDAVAKARKKGGEDAAAAQQKYNDAVRALKDFDAAAVVNRERAATDRLIASLEKAAAARALAYEKTDNMYELGLRTAQQEIASLDQRMAAEVKFSDAWMSLYRQRAQVLQDVADRQKAAVDAAVSAAQQIADAAESALTDASSAQRSALDHLNQLLDAEAAAREHAAAAQQKYDDAVAAIQRRAVQREAEYYAQVAGLASQFRAEQDQALGARTAQLASWARIDQLAAVGWGNSVEQLIDNARAQLAAFDEWQDALADARRRGVSEAVIASLGLDEGPQALGALRQFSNATQSEIDALNAAVLARTQQANAEVAVEQQHGYGQLGRDLLAAQQQYVDALDSAHRAYLDDQAAMQADLAAAQQTFADEQAAAATELAAVGQEQGRSYGAALAAGLASQIPAVRAAAQALQAEMNAVAAAQAALAQAKAAQAAAAAPAAAPAAPAPANPTAAQSAKPGATTSSYIVDGHDMTAWYNNMAIADTLWDKVPKETASNDAFISGLTGNQLSPMQLAYADKYAISYRMYDQGGYLQPGFTLAYNGTGQPERIRTAAQETALGAAAPVNVRVFLGDRELTDLVRVEMDGTLGARQGSAQIAGART